MAGPQPERELYTMKLDTTGHVRVRISGFWSRSDAEIFCRQLNELVDQSRALHGGARILVDRRGAPVQPAEVADILGANSRTLDARERLALVLDSALPAVQLRRVVTHADMRVFQDYADAEAWLDEGWSAS